MPTPQRRSLVGRADDRSISQCPGLRAASFGCRAGQEEQTPSSAASAQSWCVGPAVPRSRYVDPPTPLREPEQATAPPQPGRPGRLPPGRRSDAGGRAAVHHGRRDRGGGRCRLPQGEAH